MTNEEYSLKSGGTIFSTQRAQRTQRFYYSLSSVLSVLSVFVYNIALVTLTLGGGSGWGLSLK